MVFRVRMRFPLLIQWRGAGGNLFQSEIPQYFRCVVTNFIIVIAIIIIIIITLLI